MATTTTNGSSGAGVGSLSWGNAREIVMIGLILIGGWWGLVYSPINEKFQNFKEADAQINAKFEAFQAEERKKAGDFVTRRDFSADRKEIETKIEFNSLRITRIRDSTISSKEFKLYSEPVERRVSLMEQNFMSRDAFKLWEDKNTQINQLLTERINALSARLNEIERRQSMGRTPALPLPTERATP